MLNYTFESFSGYFPRVGLQMELDTTFVLSISRGHIYNSCKSISFEEIRAFTVCIFLLYLGIELY